MSETLAPARADDRRARFGERELTAAVDLCDGRGQLNPAAVGWSRHPLHRCNLRGHWPRKKRWDFWGVTSDDFMFALTFGCTDYVGIAAVTWLEYGAGQRLEHVRMTPFARGLAFPETVAGGDLGYQAGGDRFAIIEESGGTRLVCGCRLRDGRALEADVLVERPRHHETLNVVIPWSPRSFQFTSKQNTRPARGVVRLAGREFRFEHANQSFGVLDYGRGVWPYRSVWNWGAASGWQDGRTVGLNLGGKWTDGTGMTENGICVAGRLHKISEPLTWEYDRLDYRRPWRMHTPVTGRVDLRFTPMHHEHQRVELGFAGTDLHWLLGRYDGRVINDAGDIVEIRQLLGWAEEHTARW